METPWSPESDQQVRDDASRIADSVTMIPPEQMSELA